MIRHSERFVAREFFSYLKFLPQVELHRKCLDDEILYLPTFTDDDAVIGVAHQTYHPERLPIIKAAKKAISKTKTKRKRHKKGD